MSEVEKDAVKEEKKKKAPAWAPKSPLHKGMGPDDLVASCPFEDGKFLFSKGEPVPKALDHWLKEGLVLRLIQFESKEEEAALAPKAINVHGSARVHRSR